MPSQVCRLVSPQHQPPASPRSEVKSKGFQECGFQITVQILALPSTGCVTLGKWLHLSEHFASLVR